MTVAKSVTFGLLEHMRAPFEWRFRKVSIPISRLLYIDVSVHGGITAPTFWLVTACYCDCWGWAGEGGEDNNVLCSTFLVSVLFQDMLLHDVCTGRGEGGEDSNVLCSTHTESTTPVTRNRVQPGTEDVLPKVVVGHDMM